MGKLPSDIKLSPHARARLEERKNINMKYNMSNIIKSSVKWYNKDDLIHDCALYRHCCYTTRKSKQIGYITDGDIEVLYDKGTHIAITVLEVKDKFKPITQFIKPEVLKRIEMKKERKKMETELKPEISFCIPVSDLAMCHDCGRMEKLNRNGVCKRCAKRKINAKATGREYIRYLDLSEEEKERIDNMVKSHAKTKKVVKEEKPIELTVPDNNTYYVEKANQTEITTHPMRKPIENKFKPLEDQASFVNILREHGCEIPENTLNDVLDILVNTNKLKDILMVIAKDNCQQGLLDLDQALNVVERKLQHNWEYNGFQEVDDIKFKGFLTWRRMLKGSIYFWKKLYSSNAIIEMQRAWESYTADPTEKVVLSSDKDRMSSTLKRYQITTETISTIYNTKRPFTRVFYAQNENEAYDKFTKWLADRQLHENKTKTTIVELKIEGEKN